MTTVALECRCGKVRGMASGITPSSGNRVVCCCSDCQAFVNELERSDTLDQFGGSELYQTSQSQVKIVEGADQLQCLRLSPKGLLRWYTGCCNTPVANTINASMPFVGIMTGFMKDIDRESVLGPVRAYVQTQHAIGTPDYPHSALKFPLGITLRIIRKMLGWKIRGMHKPSAFFRADGTPVSKPTVLK